MDHATLVTIDGHLPGAFTFRIKVTESGALFLVLPRRDPAQPRFWCGDQVCPGWPGRSIRRWVAGEAGAPPRRSRRNHDRHPGKGERSAR